MSESSDAAQASRITSISAKKRKMKYPIEAPRVNNSVEKKLIIGAVRADDIWRSMFFDSYLKVGSTSKVNLLSGFVKKTTSKAHREHS